MILSFLNMINCGMELCSSRNDYFFFPNPEARLPRTFSAVFTAASLFKAMSISGLRAAGSFFFKNLKTIITMVCAVAVGIPV